MGTKIIIQDIDKNKTCELYIEDILYYKIFWENQDSNILEIKKINIFSEIETWKDIDHDLYRLLLLININNDNFILLKKIIGIMIYDIFYKLKLQTEMIKIIKSNDDIVIDYFSSASTKQDSINYKNNKKYSKLELVIDNNDTN